LAPNTQESRSIKDSNDDNDENHLEREVAALECALRSVSLDTKDQKKNLKRLKNKVDTCITKIEVELIEARTHQIDTRTRNDTSLQDLGTQLKEMVNRLISIKVQLASMVFNDQVGKATKTETEN